MNPPIVAATHAALPPSIYLKVSCHIMQVLPSNHPDTAGTLNNLALLYKAKGEYKKAVPLYERSLAIIRSVRGDGHSETATCMSNLALLLKMMGEHDRAVKLYKKALSVRETTCGPDHPDTAISLNNLAEQFCVMRRDADVTD